MAVHKRLIKGNPITAEEYDETIEDLKTKAKKIKFVPPNWEYTTSLPIAELYKTNITLTKKAIVSAIFSGHGSVTHAGSPFGVIIGNKEHHPQDLTFPNFAGYGYIMSSVWTPISHSDFEILEAGTHDIKVVAGTGEGSVTLNGTALNIVIIEIDKELPND